MENPCLPCNKRYTSDCNNCKTRDRYRRCNAYGHEDIKGTIKEKYDSSLTAKDKLELVNDPPLKPVRL